MGHHVVTVKAASYNESSLIDFYVMCFVFHSDNVSYFRVWRSLSNLCSLHRVVLSRHLTDLATSFLELVG